MSIFNRESIGRFNESELRDKYLRRLKKDNKVSLILSILFSVIVILNTSASIIYERYLMLIPSVLLILCIIFLLVDYSFYIEQIFENRRIEDA